jgi:hypothetical protein
MSGKETRLGHGVKHSVEQNLLACSSQEGRLQRYDAVSNNPLAVATHLRGGEGAFYIIDSTLFGAEFSQFLEQIAPRFLAQIAPRFAQSHAAAGGYVNGGIAS